MSHMQRAVELARQVVGYTSPNPAVGAVLVKDDAEIGSGATQPPGQDHAEIVALKQASDQARGATLYTTFSPCLMCTKMIINSGITEVVYNTAYPLGDVALDLLRDAGVKVRQVALPEG